MADTDGHGLDQGYGGITEWNEEGMWYLHINNNWLKGDCEL